MIRHTYFLASTAMALAVLPGQIHADYLQDTLWEQCSPESRDMLANTHRAAIEEHVRRAEASIIPPTPVGDLSCLTDLMEEPLDFFSGGAGLFDSFSNLFDSFTNMGFDEIAIDGINQMICDFAADKWQDVTGSLTGFSLEEITGISMDPFEDVGGLIPNFSGGFNMPSSNNTNTTTSGGYSGPSSSSAPIEVGGNGSEDVPDTLTPEEIAEIEDQNLEILQQEVRRSVREEINDWIANNPGSGGN